MQLRKLGHSCLLVDNGSGRVLLDPGVWATDVDSVEGLTAVLVTHQHPDHLDVDRLPAIIDRNPEARLVTDPATAEIVRDKLGLNATVAAAGQRFDVGVTVEAVGSTHAEIHPEIPRIPNVGYLLDGRLLHPGDALSVTDREVEILALPTMAPWMRMADAVEFLRAVRPRVAVPIHDWLLKSTDIYYNSFRSLGPDGTELRVLDDGMPASL